MMVEKMAPENPFTPPRLFGQNRIRLVGIIFSTFFVLIAVQLAKLTLIHKLDVSGKIIFKNKSIEFVGTVQPIHSKQVLHFQER